MATNSHIIAIPFPLQGHINPMVQLCNRLISKGIRVTLVTTFSISKTLQNRTDENTINIETVPDIDSTVNGGVVENLDIYEVFIRNFRASITNGVPDIIRKHSSSGHHVKAVVYDSVIPWCLDIAKGNGLRGAVLFTQPCTVCSIFYHLHEGNLEISSDEVGFEVSLPGMPVMGLKDLPTLVYDMNSYPSLLRLLVEQFSTFENADWRLFNTFDKLEDEILKWMSNKYPIRTIGPTVPSMYADKRLKGNYDYGLSLFKPSTESCFQWLETKEDRSVIYVSFGSLADLTEKQMEELAWGLVETKRNFLWVVRETEQCKIPKDFVSERGLIVNWCTQLEVLSHRSVGCFFTHGGWNSTLEALCLGVALVVMPQWTDQTTNAKLIADVWRNGVRVKCDPNGIVSREEVVACVNEVMEGESGDVIRRNAVKWKEMAVEAVSEGGSSDTNIAEFAEEILRT
ncbi:hypothetical protein ABFS82_07G104900 [Erythranthe guttata]